MYDTASWEKLWEKKFSRSVSSIGFDKDGANFVLRSEGSDSDSLISVSTSNGALKEMDTLRIDATTWLGRNQIAVLGRESRRFTQKDKWVKQIDIWDVNTGQMTMRILSPNASSIIGSDDGTFLLASRPIHINTPACIERWELAKPDGVSDYLDMFEEERRLEFIELEGRDKRGKVGKAPYVYATDAKLLKKGMTYPEVMRLFLGQGDFSAEIVEEGDERIGPTIQAKVVYDAVGSLTSQYILIFQADPFDEPYELKLVRWEHVE